MNEYMALIKYIKNKHLPPPPAPALVDAIGEMSDRPMLPQPPPRLEPRGRPRFAPRGGCRRLGFPKMPSNENDTEN